MTLEPGDPPDPMEDDEPSDPRGIVRRAGRSARPVDAVPERSSGFSPPSEEHADGARFLSSLTTRSPFFDYFCSVAERSYPGKVAEGKVRRLQEVHPFFYGFCVVADVALRLLVLAILVLVATVVAYKTFTPLPPLFEPSTAPVAPPSP